MVVKMAGLGRSFAGVAAYCLHDRREPGKAQPESAERVEWTDTRNLPTSRGDRAAAVMAATAEAAPELKRLAGGSARGRKLEKPVCHYSLSWARDEAPERQEMSRAAAESLNALGLEKHQALIVAHRDGHPHVHVIVNRVDAESGKAAGLSKSKLHLSKWAEGYEQGQGRIRCLRRVARNTRRGRGERVRDWVSVSTGRHRREKMNPHQEPREAIAAGVSERERERVAWRRAEERTHWERLQRRRGKQLGDREYRSRREWAELYGRQGRQREQLAKDGRGVLGRWRRWREVGALREFGGALRGSAKVLGRWREELKQRHRRERVALGKTHFEEVRAIERGAGEAYRSGMEESEERAEVAARTGGWNVHIRYDPPIDHWKLRSFAEQERLQQVREIYGEQAYEEQKRARERASQPPVPSRFPSHDKPQRRGPDRGSGPSR